MTATDTPARDTTWEATLSQLEADIAAARTLLASPVEGSDSGAAAPSADAYETYLETLTDWQPPASLGPLPEVLLPRALSILAAQHEVADSLTRAMAANTRQRGFAARVTGATSRPAGPAYLDITA